MAARRKTVVRPSAPRFPLSATVVDEAEAPQSYRCAAQTRPLSRQPSSLAFRLHLPLERLQRRADRLVHVPIAVGAEAAAEMDVVLVRGARRVAQVGRLVRSGVDRIVGLVAALGEARNTRARSPSCPWGRRARDGDGGIPGCG